MALLEKFLASSTLGSSQTMFSPALLPQGPDFSQALARGDVTVGFSLSVFAVQKCLELNEGSFYTSPVM